MVQSSRSGRPRKPAKPKKPYPDFPLFPHATKRWAKKIRGKMHYFGPWDDPGGALQKYLDQRDDLHAGRTPRVQGEGLTVRDLCNRFLTSKQRLLDAGELSPRTWRDYHATCAGLVSAFGKSRLVSDLATDDFERLRAGLAERARRPGPTASGGGQGRERSREGLPGGSAQGTAAFAPADDNPSGDDKVTRIRMSRELNGPRCAAAPADQKSLRPEGPEPSTGGSACRGNDPDDTHGIRR